MYSDLDERKREREESRNRSRLWNWIIKINKRERERIEGTMAARGYARNAKKTEAGEEKITLLIPRKEKIKGTLLRERER